MGRFLLPCGNGRLRAAQIVGNAKLGGVVSSILNYYSHIDRTRWRFDFFTYGPSSLDEKLKELSEEIKTALSPSFDLYGLSLMQFFVTTVIRPEGDPQYENLKQLYFRRYADVADAQIRQQVGIIEQQTEPKRR